MEPEGSLPRLQLPTTCPYPEPNKSNPEPHIPLPARPILINVCCWKRSTYTFTAQTLRKTTINDGIENAWCTICIINQWRTQEFFFQGGGGVQQIQLRTENIENGDIGAVAT